MTHGIVLYSGGLDSLLAAKVLMDQGIRVTGFHCILPFTDPNISPEELHVSKLAQQIDLPLVHYRCDREYIDMVKNPPHGYGKAVNPCIDCKIFFIRQACKYMTETGADFIATGEVVGQRPMSQQKHTMNHILKETGLQDRLLRPLSAKILKPTLVEKEGLVDREALLDISGRGRRRQMELAEELGITDYTSPAGGCLFTDQNIARRVRDMFENYRETSPLDLFLMTIGRHFRINEKAKIIVSRNEKENLKLEEYREMADIYMKPDFRGPAVFFRGTPDEGSINKAAAVLSRYGKPDETEHSITITVGKETIKIIEAPAPVDEKVLESMRI